MKKQMYFLLALFVFVVTLNIKITNHSNQLPAIYLSNIETLSFAESSETCYGIGSVDCQSGGVKVKIVF
jgi:hypothetical protein